MWHWKLLAPGRCLLQQQSSHLRFSLDHDSRRNRRQLAANGEDQSNRAANFKAAAPSHLQRSSHNQSETNAAAAACCGTADRCSRRLDRRLVKTLDRTIFKLAGPCHALVRLIATRVVIARFLCCCRRRYYCYCVRDHHCAV